MSIKNKLHLLGVIFAVFLYNDGFSQSSSSTYSSFGLGEFNNSGLTQNQAMGGLGISYGDVFHANLVNPALSVKNTAFNFQAALNYERLAIASSAATEHLDGGGLSYVVLSLPVDPGKWTIGMGLNQISSVNYNLSATSPVANSDLLSSNNIQGSGGITEAYLQTGFRLFKNLSLGVQGSYVFGSTIRTNRVILMNEDLATVGTPSEYYERLTLADVAVKAGAYYAQPLGDQKFLNFGAIYHIFGDLNGVEFAKVANSGEASDPDSAGDILSNDKKGTVFLPNKLGYGVSYENTNKFVVGLEFQQQNFSEYRNFNGTVGELTDFYKVGLGAQFTPNLFSMDNVLERISYRVGLEYEQTPFILNGQEIKDIGINFGGSIPMNNLSLLNLAFKLGTRGNTDNGLIRENYFKVSLGFSINDNSWFYKRVFE